MGGLPRGRKHGHINRALSPILALLKGVFLPCLPRAAARPEAPIGHGKQV